MTQSHSLLGKLPAAVRSAAPGVLRASAPQPHYSLPPGTPSRVTEPDSRLGWKSRFLQFVLGTKTDPKPTQEQLDQFIGFQYSAYISGEVRGNVKRGILIAARARSPR